MDKSKHQVGFTLLELVVAAAVSAILLILIVRIVSVMLDSLERSTGDLSRNEEIANVRRYLESDVQSAYANEGWLGGYVFRKPGEGWGAGDWDAVPVDAKPTVFDVSSDAQIAGNSIEERWGKEGAQIAWLVNDPNKGLQDPGGLKAVAYQIKRKRLSNELAPRYYLMRSEVSALQTMQAGYDLQGDDYREGSYREDAYWAAPVIRYPNLQHVVANNVIDFGLRAYIRRPDRVGWELVFPGEAGVYSASRMPEIWVVFMRVLSDSGAEMIENIEQGRVQANWWETALQYSEVVCFTLPLVR